MSARTWIGGVGLGAVLMRQVGVQWDGGRMPLGPGPRVTVMRAAARGCVARSLASRRSQSAWASVSIDGHVGKASV